MASFIPKSDKLHELLACIDEGKIRLPCFQRDYKWKAVQVKKLFDSIQKTHPAGSLLFLSVSDEPIISDEPFKYTINEKLNKKCEFLVLDGQQRLTSCYCAFYNKGLNSYYLDLNQLYELDRTNRDIDFEFIIVTKKNENYPDVNLKYNLMPLSFLKNRETFRGSIKSYKGSFRSDPNKKDFSDFLEDKLEKYLDPIFDYEIPVITLPKDLSLDAVCKVFQRINTTGLRLSAFDICVAKFMREGINLKDKVKQAISIDTVNIALKDDETIVLQAIALLADRSPKKNKLADNLKKSDIDSWWDKAILGLDYAIKLLDGFGCGCCKNLSLLPYRPILPVIAAIFVSKTLDNLQTKIKSNIEQKLKIYFYHTALSLRYTEGTDNKIFEDYHTLLRWFGGGTEPELISEGIQWNLDKYIKAKPGGAIGKSILCIYNYNTPQDFYFDKNVGMSSYSVTSELHHIFPKTSYSHELIDSVFNITFLSSESNNFIKNKKTKSYFDELLKERDISFEIGKSIMAKHYINDNCFKYFYSEEFENFIKARAIIIKDFLINNIGLKIYDVTDAQMDSSIDEDLDTEADT